MQYAVVYGHEYNGTLIAGPNAGRLLENERMDNHDWSEEDAIREAEERRSQINGTIRVYSRQYFDKEPKDHSGEWHKNYKMRGGFLLCYIS